MDGQGAEHCPIWLKGELGSECLPGQKEEGLDQARMVAAESFLAENVNWHRTLLSHSLEPQG